MGTSKSYNPSVKNQPQWGDLSRAVVSSCGKGKVDEEKLQTILSRYVTVAGGSGASGRGNSMVAGKAGIRTATSFGSFLSELSGNGYNVRDTFSALGYDNIDGKRAPEIVDLLIEYFAGAASSIDDVAAKSAIQKTLEEIVGNADTAEELENKFKEAIAEENIGDILIRFFGYYIFERLAIMLYEKLIVAKGKTDCDDLFSQIKDFIFERIKNLHNGSAIKSVNWKGAEGERIIKNIQEDILKIFE